MPDQLGLPEPPPCAWSDSMRPIPARICQLKPQLGALRASAVAARSYARRASWGIAPLPRFTARSTDFAPNAVAAGPTEAGCRKAAKASPGTIGIGATEASVGTAVGELDPAAGSALKPAVGEMSAAFSVPDPECIPPVAAATHASTMMTTPHATAVSQGIPGRRVACRPARAGADARAWRDVTARRGSRTCRDSRTCRGPGACRGASACFERAFGATR